MQKCIPPATCPPLPAKMTSASNQTDHGRQPDCPAFPG
jgi:hypothetical protein